MAIIGEPNSSPSWSEKTKLSRPGLTRKRCEPEMRLMRHLRHNKAARIRRALQLGRLLTPRWRRIQPGFAAFQHAQVARRRPATRGILRRIRLPPGWPRWRRMSVRGQSPACQHPPGAFYPPKKPDLTDWRTLPAPSGHSPAGRRRPRRKMLQPA